jgi:hypothetical protein
MRVSSYTEMGTRAGESRQSISEPPGELPRRNGHRDPLIAELAQLLSAKRVAEAAAHAERLGQVMEHAGLSAARLWLGRHARQDQRRDEWRRLRDDTARTNKVVSSYESRRRKLGKKRAAERAVRNWDLPLTSKDKKAPPPLPPPRPDLWENEVGDALIGALEAGLARPLTSSRTVAAKAEIEVLTAAFSMVHSIAPEAPALRRGKGVREPGSTSWFKYRIATLKRRVAPTQ